MTVRMVITHAIKIAAKKYATLASLIHPPIALLETLALDYALNQMVSFIRD